MMCGNANWLQVSLICVTYGVTMRFIALISLLLMAGCNSNIYTRDGITDGDTFYLSPSAFADEDPAYQSWVAYSLMKSTCQLGIGGENPARASSFDCEFTARRHLVNAWEEQSSNNQELTDGYLDALSAVNEAGYLAEYTSHYLGQDDWQLPEGLRVNEFGDWRQTHLQRHRSKTRLTGSWNYQKRVAKHPY